MISNGLDYHHLLYFWAVAKEGSLRLAGQVLHVSQPSISGSACFSESVIARLY